MGQGTSATISIEESPHTPAIAIPSLDLKEKLNRLMATGASAMALRQFISDVERIELQHQAFGALAQVACDVSRVAGSLDVHNLMHFVLDEALSLVGAERGLLVLRNVQDGQFEVAAARHLKDVDSEESHFSKTLLRQVINSGETIITTNAQNDPRFSDQQSIMALAIRSVLAVPLATPGGIIGALYLDTQILTRIFDEDDLPIISAFAGITASALELARSIETRQELYLESVKVMVNAIEAKDPYTAGHSSRVGLYAQGIVRALGKREELAEQALIAGYLHDVGKIGIQDAYVSKPGPLDDNEWEDFKQHPVIGEKILSHSRALKPMLSAVRWHHEKLDGSGYPDGLKNKQIPFMARVIGVADSFDAMTSDRPYRKSPGKDYAFSELKRFTHKHYDARVVKALELAFDKRLVPYLGKG